MRYYNSYVHGCCVRRSRHLNVFETRCGGVFFAGEDRDGLITPCVVDRGGHVVWFLTILLSGVMILGKPSPRLQWVLAPIVCLPTLRSCGDNPCFKPNRHCQTLLEPERWNCSCHYGHTDSKGYFRVHRRPSQSIPMLS